MAIDGVWRGGVAGDAGAQKESGQVRYWVWLAASMKFVVPFSLLVGVGELAPKHAAIAPMVQTEWVVAVEQAGRPLALLPAAPRPKDYTDMPWVIWGTGFAAMLFLFGRKWTRMYRNVLAAKPVSLGFPIPVRESAAPIEPGVFGVFRPILVLPEGIGGKLTPAQFQAILAHELCHVRRRDNLTATVHMLVQSIFWFHPLLWWIGARLIEERERACDEEVLRLGSAPQDYAEGILNVCKLYAESPVACISGVTGSDLKKRIEAIMRNRIVRGLTFGRKVVLAGAGMVAAGVPVMIGLMHAPAVRAQGAPFQIPRWEAVAIRRCDDTGGRGESGSPSPGRLNACATVTTLIQSAYVLFANGHLSLSSYVPVEGGPAWIKSDPYRITGKAEGNPGQEVMRGPMMQALLEDRFRLRIHRETREVPVYALTVAKGGSKLTPSKEGSCTPIDLTRAPAPPAEGQKPPSLCGMGTGQVKGPIWTGDFHRVSMMEFSQQLPFGRPVIDKTGLVGVFDFHLEYTAQEAQGALPSDDPARGPSIFTAVQEQLGLKLEPAKGPGDFLVIDSIDRPSEN